MKKVVSAAILAILGVLLSLVLWEIAALIAPTLVPHAWEIAVAIKHLVLNPTTQLDFLKTLTRTLLAFSIAVGIGVPLGLAIGSVRPLNLMFGGPIDFLRSLPAFILLPLFLIFFNSGNTARVAVAAFGAGLVIVANTAFGTVHVNQLRIEVARVYGAGRLFILFRVIAKEVMPQAIDGMRLGLSLSLVLVIVSEIMLGATYGLGTRVNDSLVGFELPRMYGLIFLIGAMGYLFNVVGRLVSKKLVYYGRYL